MWTSFDRLEKTCLFVFAFLFFLKGGSWDDSDVGAKKKWSNADKKYVANAAPVKNEFLGTVERRNGKKGTASQKNPPPPPRTKKLFGLF